MQQQALRRAVLRQHSPAVLCQAQRGAARAGPDLFNLAAASRRRSRASLAHSPAPFCTSMQHCMHEVLHHACLCIALHTTLTP